MLVVGFSYQIHCFIGYIDTSISIIDSSIGYLASNGRSNMNPIIEGLIPIEIKEFLKTFPFFLLIVYQKEEISKTKDPKFLLELLSFKFILNPVRLAILKLLDNNLSLPSFELRQELNISWGNLTPHLNSLEERKYIETSTQFVNNKAVKTVRILPQGDKILNELQIILFKLFYSESFDTYED